MRDAGKSDERLNGGMRYGCVLAGLPTLATNHSANLFGFLKDEIAEFEEIEVVKNIRSLTK
jgi:hypothetical protein